jgi:hypothetical protein
LAKERAARENYSRYGVAPGFVVAFVIPGQAPRPKALFPVSNHKGYRLATLKIWGTCGKCTPAETVRAMAVGLD